MATKVTKIGRYFKGRMNDILFLAFGTVPAGIVDYLGGSGINHPAEDIAFSAGLLGGIGSVSENASEMVTSFLIVGASMYPDVVSSTLSADFGTFLKGAVPKIASYGIGILLGASFAEKIKEKYDGMFEVNAVFKDEEEANKVFDYLGEFAIEDDDIWLPSTSIDRPQKNEEGFYLHAKIVGKTETLERRLQPSLKSHFEMYVRPIKLEISEPVQIRKREK